MVLLERPDAPLVFQSDRADRAAWRNLGDHPPPVCFDPLFPLWTAISLPVVRGPASLEASTDHLYGRVRGPRPEETVVISHE